MDLTRLSHANERAPVTAYREVLKERTRERVPLDWAVTLNSLGNALTTLGQRESGTAQLEEAVAAYDAALTVFVPARADYYTDTCRANRDRALAQLTESPFDAARERSQRSLTLPAPRKQHDNRQCECGMCELLR